MAGDGPNSEILDLVRQLRETVQGFKAKKWDVPYALGLCKDLVEISMDTKKRSLAETLERVRGQLNDHRDRAAQDTAAKKKLLALLDQVDAALITDPLETTNLASTPEATTVETPAAPPKAPQTLQEILMAAFIEECEAAFPTIRDSLDRFQASTQPEEKALLIEPAFRGAHSIKGAARAIELHEAEMMAASLEKSLRSAAKLQTAHFDDAAMAHLLVAIDLLEQISISYRDGSQGPQFDVLNNSVENLEAVKGIAPPVKVVETIAEPETDDDNLEGLLRDGFRLELEELIPQLRDGLTALAGDSAAERTSAARQQLEILDSLTQAVLGAEISAPADLLNGLSRFFAALDTEASPDPNDLNIASQSLDLLDEVASSLVPGAPVADHSKIAENLEMLELVTGLGDDDFIEEPSLVLEPEAPRETPISAQPVSVSPAEYLHAAFFEEAASFQTDFFSGLRDYRATDTPAQRVAALKPVYRAVHSLRGAARAVDLAEAELLCATLEQKLRLATEPHRSRLTAVEIEAIEAAGETLAASVTALKENTPGPSRQRVRQILDALEGIDPGAPEQSIEMAITLEDSLPLADPASTLQALFREEAEDYLVSLNQLLVEFERDLDDERAYDILEKVFRDVHSLKGASRSVGLEKVERVCQGLEDVYSKLKRKELTLSQDALDISFRAIDVVNRLLDREPVSESELDDLDIELRQIAQGARPVTATAKAKTRVKPAAKAEASPVPVAVAPPSPERETVRLQVTKLDGLLLQAEEMLTIKLKATQRANEIRTLGEEISIWDRQHRKIAPTLVKLKGTEHGLEAVTDFIAWSQKYIRSLESQVKALHRNSVQDERLARGLVDNILEDAKQLLLFPFSSLLERFPRLVRDLARDLSKDVDFQVKGQDIEIDRRILDELRDPLTHLVRNAIDHGLETSTQRVKAGKGGRGQLEIVVSRETAEHILVEIRDDGLGIDTEKLRRKAISKGLYTQEQAARLSEPELLNLIFLSDFSTAEQVTEVSGRGLGMPIVADKVAALGGTVSVRSELGKGTRFVLRLPIRRATYNGILVSVSGETVVIPTTSVVSVHRFDLERDVKTVEGQATVEVQGRVVPIVRLQEVLNYRDGERFASSHYLLAVMLEYQNHRAAFIVDELIAEQEVLAKKPAAPLHKIATLAGTTILGNGRVAPILNVAALIDPLVKATVRSTKEDVAPQRAKAESYKILLCDDSITSRTLLTHILSNAGYNVTARVDGAQAYEALLDGDFDLLCSDVEMPNMTGLELCAKVRQTPGFEDLPIILITTLDDPEDHKKGADAGASAYVVKGRLDQDHLLETVEFLL